MKRKRDLHFASQHHHALHSACEIHRLQSAIHKISEKYKNDPLMSPMLKEIAEFSHPSALNIVRFQYKDNPYDLCSKDYEFSNQSIQENIQAGLNDVKKALLNPAWLDLIADDTGLVFHEF